MKIAVVILLFASSLVAQEAEHKFFDKTARFTLLGSAAIFATDAVTSCQNFANYGREIILPVKNCAGISVWMAGSSASQIGSAYLFHRSGHHKLERFVEITWSAGSMIGIGYTLSHRGPALRYVPPHTAPGVIYTGGYCIVGQTC